ncbi:kelch-like protein 35 [Glandiceps talaboti]
MGNPLSKSTCGDGIFLWTKFEKGLLVTSQIEEFVQGLWRSRSGHSVPKSPTMSPLKETLREPAPVVDVSSDLKSENHAMELLSRLQNLREDQVLTDVVIDSRGRYFHCHLVVLAATSTYFEQKLRNRFSGDSYPQNGCFELHHIDPFVLGLLIDYMYGKTVCCTSQILEDVSDAATFLKISNIPRFRQPSLSNERRTCETHLEGADYVNILRKLEEFRMENFTDVAIEVKDEIFHAHRCVLAGSSDYFSAMFTSNMSEMSTDVIRVVDDISATLGILLQFVYTGHIDLRDIEVETLLFSTILYQFPTITQSCEQYLSKKLKPENSVGIWCFAKELALSGLGECARKFSLAAFRETVQSEDFLNQSVNDLKELLSGDEMAVDAETTVVDAILTWINVDPERRSEYFEELLCTVRFPYLHKKSFKMTLNSNEISTGISNSSWERLSMASSSISPRKYDNVVLFFECVDAQGYVNTFIDKVTYYDPRLDEWYSLTTLPWPQHNMITAAVVPNLVHSNVVVFVTPLSNDFIDMWLFTPGDFVPWVKVPSPPIANLKDFGSAVWKDQVFIIGGCDSLASWGDQQVVRSEVFSFDILTKTWKEVARLPRAVGCLDGHVVTCNDHIYVIGGCDGRQNTLLVQRYDPKKNRWDLVDPFPGETDEMDFAVGMDDGIYIKGSDKIYKYCTATDSWFIYMDENTPLTSAFSSAITDCDGKIYIFGGHYKEEPSIRVHVYDPKDETWETKGTMPDWFHRRYPACSWITLPKWML